MSCNIKQNSIQHLIKKGAIKQGTREILDYSKFERENFRLTEQAKVKYNVGDGNTQLFLPATHNVAHGHSEQKRRNVLRAQPNEFLFDELQSVIDRYEDNKVDSNVGKKLNTLISEDATTFLDYTERIKTKSKELDQADYLETTSNILFKGGNPTNSSEVLQNLIDSFTGFNEETNQLVEKAKLMLDGVDSNIKYVSDSALSSPDTIMEYNPSTNEIIISKDRLAEVHPDIAIEAFLHEVVHSSTIKALKTPSTMDEKLFRDEMNDLFEYFRGLSNSKSYGFTNVEEFVAEAFTNSEFQQELKSLEFENKTIWDNIVDFIRSLFGLPKSQKFSEVIDSISNIIVANNYSIEGNKVNLPIYQKVGPLKQPKTKKIGEELSYQINVAKDNLSNAIKKAQNSENKSAYKEEFIEGLEELVSSMEKYEGAKQWKAITSYLEELDKTVNILSKSFEKKDKDSDEILDTISNYKSYLDTFDLLKPIQKLVARAKRSKDDVIDAEELATIDNVLTDLVKDYDSLVDDFISLEKEVMVDVLADPKYLTSVETEMREKLEKEHRNKKLQGDRTQWVNKQLATTYEQEYKDKLREEAENLVYNVGYDIGAFDKHASDPLNSSGRLIAVSVNIIADMREKIIKDSRDYEFELDALYKELVKEKGTSDPKKLYKNIFKRAKDGSVYITDEVSIDFLNEMSNYNAILSEMQERSRVLKEQGYSEAQIKGDKSYNIHRRKRNAWLKKNTKRVSETESVYNNKFIAKDKLSDTEKKVISTYKKLLETTAQETGQKVNSSQSLIVEKFGARYYKLPAVSKTNAERLASLDGKGIVDDNFKDIGKVRKDDVGYATELTNSRGEALRNVRVHYRSKLDEKIQSNDLFTMMRLERLNGINYREKTKVESTMQAMIDIASNKNYYKTVNGASKFIQSKFNSNEPVVTFDGKMSNEAARLASYMETNIYDVLHTSSPQLAGMDVNKLTQFVNGTAAFVGMSVNVASGMANVTNGFSQLFIEAVGGNHISMKSLLKAEAKYTRELPNTLVDLQNPVKKAFVNQLNEMFDVFGGFSPSTQAFVQDNFAKKFASSHSLSMLQEMGEHMMQSILTMAVLENVQVMNKDHKFIDKDGKVVDKKDAASMLDMLSINEKTGKLEMDSKVVFTPRNMTSEYNNGGKSHLNIFIKKKIHDTMGAYDPNNQPDLYRTWYGKVLFMFKRFLIPGMQNRWKGVSTINKKRNDLTDLEKNYNTALKEYSEGTYTTLLRFIWNGIVPSLKHAKLLHTQEYWKDMSDYERANLRKSVTEAALIAGVFVLISVVDKALEDEDDELAWYGAYQLRRLASELWQYSNPREAWRITENPIAGARIIQNTLKVLSDFVQPWDWMEEDSKGKNIFIKDIKKITPIWVQLDKQWKRSYQFLENQAK